MVSYEGKLFLLLSKYLRKFRETQWTYIFHIWEFQHIVMFKILGKTLQNPSCLFQAIEIFLYEIFPINPIKIIACHT